MSPFRQCPAAPVRPGQHGLFLKTLPDEYMCYFHIYAHIYKVIWAKLNFLTSYSGRQGRFLRCVSLSANEKPSPRHCVQQGLLLKIPVQKHMCYIHIYMNISVRYFRRNSLFWHPRQATMTYFWDVSHLRQMHSLLQRSVGQRAYSIKIHREIIYATFIHLYLYKR